MGEGSSAVKDSAAIDEMEGEGRGALPWCSSGQSMSCCGTDTEPAGTSAAVELLNDDSLPTLPTSESRRMSSIISERDRSPLHVAAGLVARCSRECRKVPPSLIAERIKADRDASVLGLTSDRGLGAVQLRE